MVEKDKATDCKDDCDPVNLPLVSSLTNFNYRIRFSTELEEAHFHLWLEQNCHSGTALVIEDVSTDDRNRKLAVYFESVEESRAFERFCRRI